MERVIFPLKRKQILDKGFVELWKSSLINLNQESRIKAVTTIASLSYGNEKSRNPEVLYNNLWKWGHLSVFEFVRSPKGDIQNSLRNNLELETIEEMSSNANELAELINTYESNVALFKLKTPQFVRDHFVRHRCFSFLVMSRRYTTDKKVPFEFYYPDYVDVTKRELLRDTYEKAVKTYNQLVLEGVHPEVARIVIPVGVYTQFFMMGNVPCLVNFFKLRLHKAAQRESRLFAEAMYQLLQQHQPRLFEKIKEEVKINE